MKQLLSFAKTVGKLKNIKRTGWVKNNIPDPESVADHSFRVTALAMFLAPRFNLNELKVLKMTIIHDLGEAEVGDIITVIGTNIVSDPAAKTTTERAGLQKILKKIGKEDYIKLFDEYEANQTPEAKFVKQLDKLEMAIQALEYEQQYKIDLNSFFQSSEPIMIDEFFKKVFQEIRITRTK